jgi:adenylyl- and sulfurtransferase ThiI
MRADISGRMPRSSLWQLGFQYDERCAHKKKNHRGPFICILKNNIKLIIGERTDVQTLVKKKKKIYKKTLDTCVVCNTNDIKYTHHRVAVEPGERRLRAVVNLKKY